MVASEALPFAKTGGLADVTSALPLALARLGYDTTLVMPRYRGVATARRPLMRIEVDLGTRCIPAAVFEHAVNERFRVWLLDQPEFYDREFPYGVGNDDYADNAVRFGFLSRAALVCARDRQLSVDVVHAHDWQAGLVPLYLRRHFADTPLATAGTVFTIHNLAYQGLADPRVLADLGFGWDLFTADALEYWGRVSLLKAGINFSDRLTTVSRRYAQEIQGPSGFGFDGIIRARAHLLTGIVNGIDTERWDPATDPYLEHHFTVDTLDGKQHLKQALLERMRLPSDGEALRRPLVGMVSRMVDQKGLDLIAAIARDLPHLGATFVVHGTGEPRYEAMWRELSGVWPDRFGVEVGYDEGLAHLIEAGSDLWLMPSRFEPCGLNQMYSQRYGTLPVVRATGGLDDTVESYEPATGTGTGFKFAAPEPAALLGTLRWALSLFHNQETWRRLQAAAMARDFSWEPAARAYAEVYEQARAAVTSPTVAV